MKIEEKHLVEGALVYNGGFGYLERIEKIERDKFHLLTLNKADHLPLMSVLSLYELQEVFSFDGDRFQYVGQTGGEIKLTLAYEYEDSFDPELDLYHVYANGVWVFAIEPETHYTHDGEEWKYLRLCVLDLFSNLAHSTKEEQDLIDSLERIKYISLPDAIDGINKIVKLLRLGVTFTELGYELPPLVEKTKK